MSTKYWRWSIVCVSAARLILNQAGAAPMTIGIALPQGQPLQSAEVAEPMRQSLISQLKAQSLDAVALSATSDSLVDAEAQAKHCRYVLYTHLEKRSGSLRGKLAGFTSMLPFGALTGKGPASSLTSMALQGAASAAASSAQQQTMSQMAGATFANVKQGDTMTMAYRLVAVGSTNPIKSETFDSSRAGSDGQDIVSPLIAQVAAAVSTSAESTPTPSTQATAPTASNDPPSPTGRPSPFSGLWGHRSASSPKPTGETMSGSMDCAKLASVPNAPMSVADCEKLQGAQHAYNQAASDPAASRPGDDQMSCAQITSELKQQQYTAPDRTKVAEANATVKKQQSTFHREYANMVKQQAENQAAVNAASAADTATELATAGLVRGRSLNAVEKAIDARNQANNERVIKEDLPITQKMVGQMADFSGDFAQQVKSDPRLARLMQLADTKHCKGSI